MELQSFSMRIESKDGSALVFFSGTLNEEAYAQYVKLAESLPKSCVFDFGGVSFINSTGVRDWIKFIRLVQTGRTIVFERCTDSLIGNMNLMPYMVGEATIKSVLRNSTCPKCGALDAILLVQGKDFDGNGHMLSDTPACRTCKTIVVWDMPDSEYFLFQRPG